MTEEITEDELGDEDVNPVTDFTLGTSAAAGGAQ